MTVIDNNFNTDFKSLLQFKPDSHTIGATGAAAVISFLWSHRVQVASLPMIGYDALLLDANGDVKTLEIKTFSSGEGYNCSFREGQANADFYAFYSTARKCVYFATRDDLNVKDKATHKNGMDVSVPKEMFTPPIEKYSLHLLQNRLGFFSGDTTLASYEKKVMRGHFMLSLHEAAERFKVSYELLESAIEAGTLKSETTIEGYKVVDPHAVQSWKADFKIRCELDVGTLQYLNHYNPEKYPFKTETTGAVAAKFKQLEEKTGLATGDLLTEMLKTYIRHGCDYARH